MLKKRTLLAASIALTLIALLAGCAQQQSLEGERAFRETSPGEPPQPESSTVVNWRSAEFTDVRTGESFSVSQFAGKPVLLESFAVWCPVCTKQQREIQKLHEEIGDAVVSISLDTDPNEDAAKVLEAAQQRGFTWRFAVSPAEITKALIEEFGPAIVNAPIAPVILVCEDQSARLLGRGTKSAEELKAEIERGC